jgi:uncharacterized iron-regulated membrane protein
MGFLDKPRRLWWRKAIFQIHLWVGLVLCLYVLIIGVTGSILVFESEIEHEDYSHLWRSSSTTHTTGPETANFPVVINTLKGEHPGYQITAAYMPDKAGDNFEVFVHKNEQLRYIFPDYTSVSTSDRVTPKDEGRSVGPVLPSLNLHANLV